jgi:2-polyprenyl-6-methoxyphenol hydroxylase-like FAD-dependent oxidoreductase
MKNKLLVNKNIAIVGGGPGGLTLARLLQVKGVHVKVYERDVHKDVRVQGATLDLHDESGLKALQHAGLMDAFKENYRPGADKIRIVDHKGDIVFDEHAADDDDTFGDETFRPEIDRGPLRKILLESLATGTVVWDSQFVSMHKEGEGWRLVFQNGSSAYADIVIAADGANSKIRPYLTSVKPFYAGVTAVEGAVYDAANKIPYMNELVQGGKIFAFGKEQSLILSSKGDGSLVFYAGFKTTEDWIKTTKIDFADKAAVAAWFKEEYKDWDESWYALFEQASIAFIPRAINSMPLDQKWDTQPNLTMLGDAAHLMPPYAGEGVNMAMLDALELSECLTSSTFENLQAAIASYEKNMLERTAEIAQISIEQTHALHASNAIENMLSIFGQ